MGFLKSILLGIIQGLTEFLPVSSSGHLVIFKHLFNFEMNNISFEIFLHLGSLSAVVIYFFQDLRELAISFFKFSSKEEKDKTNRKFILYIIVATIVTAIIGILFEDKIEELFTSPIFAASMLIITGIIIFVSDRVQNGRIDVENMGLSRSLLIGIGQSLAILPGISRSGSTIATALFTGLERKQVARFSFILSIPVILGASILKFDEFKALDVHSWAVYFCGGIAAFISGLMVISLLLKLIRRQKLKYFSFYCWAFSLIFIITYLIK